MCHAHLWPLGPEHTCLARQEAWSIHAGSRCEVDYGIDSTRVCGSSINAHHTCMIASRVGASIRAEMAASPPRYPCVLPAYKWSSRGGSLEAHWTLLWAVRQWAISLVFAGLAGDHRPRMARDDSPDHRLGKGLFCSRDGVRRAQPRMPLHRLMLLVCCFCRRCVSYAQHRSTTLTPQPPLLAASCIIGLRGWEVAAGHDARASRPRISTKGSTCGAK